MLCTLAIDFNLNSTQLWNFIFINYPAGDELLDIVRHLNHQQWFLEKFYKDSNLRKSFLQIFNFSLAKMAEGKNLKSTFVITN